MFAHFYGHQELKEALGLIGEPFALHKGEVQIGTMKEGG